MLEKSNKTGPLVKRQKVLLTARLVKLALKAPKMTHGHAIFSTEQ